MSCTAGPGDEMRAVESASGIGVMPGCREQLEIKLSLQYLYHTDMRSGSGGGPWEDPGAAQGDAQGMIDAPLYTTNSRSPPSPHHAFGSRSRPLDPRSPPRIERKTQPGVRQITRSWTWSCLFHRLAGTRSKHISICLPRRAWQ